MSLKVDILLLLWLGIIQPVFSSEIAICTPEQIESMGEYEYVLDPFECWLDPEVLLKMSKEKVEITGMNETHFSYFSTETLPKEFKEDMHLILKNLEVTRGTQLIKCNKLTLVNVNFLYNSSIFSTLEKGLPFPKFCQLVISNGTFAGEAVGDVLFNLDCDKLKVNVADSTFNSMRYFDRMFNMKGVEEIFSRAIFRSNKFQGNTDFNYLISSANIDVEIDDNRISNNKDFASLMWLRHHIGISGNQISFNSAKSDLIKFSEPASCFRMVNNDYDSNFCQNLITVYDSRDKIDMVFLNNFYVNNTALLKFAFSLNVSQITFANETYRGNHFNRYFQSTAKKILLKDSIFEYNYYMVENDCPMTNKWALENIEFVRCTLYLPDLALHYHINHMCKDFGLLPKKKLFRKGYRMGRDERLIKDNLRTTFILFR